MRVGVRQMYWLLIRDVGRGGEGMENVVLRAEYEEYRRRIEDEDARQNKRIAGLEEREKANQELVLNVQRLALSVEQMCKELTLQGQRLAKLEAEPADRWRDVTKQIITLIVAAVTSFVIGKFI